VAFKLASSASLPAPPRKMNPLFVAGTDDVDRYPLSWICEKVVRRRS
jgi:hypothetical protein